MHFSRQSSTNTGWKVFKHGVFSGPYFPAFGMNREIYGVNIRIQFECEKIRTSKSSVFGLFSRRESVDKYLKLIKTGFYVKYLRADFLQFLAQPSNFHFEWQAAYLLLISSIPGSFLKFPNSLGRLTLLILNWLLRTILFIILFIIR